MTKYQLQIRDFDNPEGWRTVKTVRTMKEAIQWRYQIMEDTGDEYEDVRIKEDSDIENYYRVTDKTRNAKMYCNGQRIL